ncbi:adenosylmethionine decarboxylase [Halteromyces radiatus]|uniref:adenosylmethionine decarboxylase n=1 Tax=Halteromyces radiatus TaxID=101107 RepID=UPI0022200F93|nr:adenosylmethionine decarboxylase [Halteromyces radiatus]KAI8098791.1 adenosylmethionine decarboxylase [Halteromyces radiatus]
MIYNPVSPPPAPPPSGANYSAEQGCFEGPEKLLEIWFSPNPIISTSSLPSVDACDSDLSDISTPSTPNNDTYCDKNLRTVEKPVWDAMLATVKCTVLNVIHNAHVDAYLLSESSMFVYPHKVIIKTCGTTTLLHALPGIINIAKTYCGLDSVYRLFYSRKSFMFPEKQPDPHRSWDNEVKYLDSYFDNGAAYIIGDTNADEWYLYLTTPVYNHQQYQGFHEQQMQRVIKEEADDDITWMGQDDCTWRRMDNTNTDRSDYFTSIQQRQQQSHHQRLDYRSHDETVEILMTGLNPKAMEAFYQQGDEPTGIPGGRRVDQSTGLHKLYPDAQVDSFLFEPCGYSANGLLDDGYYTIHVTPEPQCSYASFETTIPSTPISHPGKSSKDQRTDALCLLIRQVIDIFQPSNFTVTYFASQGNKYLADSEEETDSSLDKTDVEQLGRMMGTLDSFSGYRRKNKILHIFEGYDLVFGHYSQI